MNLIGEDIPTVKKILMSIGYGSTQSISPEAAIPQAIGVEKAKLFYAHPLYQAIKSDVAQATKGILNTHRKTNPKLVNLANRPFYSDKRKPANKMSHLLQGVEVVALEAAVRAVSDKVILLQHDGFTTSEQIDIESIQSAAKAATGFDLIFEEEKIEMPFENFIYSELYNAKFNNPSKASIHAGFEPFWPVKSGTMVFEENDLPPLFSEREINLDSPF